MSGPSSIETNRAHQHERRWLILAVVALAQLMVVLDATIVNIALPSAQADLKFGNDNRQWIVTAYALAFGSLLLLGGKIGDIFGRKWAFIGGLVGFAVASAIGGAANSFGVLVVSRALQGVFGALLAPAALSTLATAFTTPKERGRAFGIFGAVAGGGGAVGLLLGGALTEWASWRWCFFVNLFFAAIATVGALVLMRNEANPQRPKIDVLGSITAAAGLFLVVFGLSRTETDSWSDATALICMAVGLVLLVVFVLIQRRVAAPLLPLRIVLDRNRGGAFLAMGVTAIAMFGVFLFLTYFLQITKGFSPMQSGLAFVPMILFVLTGSILSNVKLLPILGARRLITTGMLLGAVGLFFLGQLSAEDSYVAHVLPILPVMGFGFGLIFATSFNTATAGVERTDAGVASATVNTMQQVGGSIGTALLSTIAAHATTTYVAAHPTAQGAIDGAVHGYTVAFRTAGSIFVVGALVIFLLIRPHVRATPDAVAPAEPAAQTPEVEATA
jgi:EmrB/QacA subfamily drug resistance transporter